jgi:hypothetical protein
MAELIRWGGRYQIESIRRRTRYRFSRCWPGPSQGLPNPPNDRSGLLIRTDPFAPMFPEGRRNLSGSCVGLPALRIVGPSEKKAMNP